MFPVAVIDILMGTTGGRKGLHVTHSPGLQSLAVEVKEAGGRLFTSDPQSRPESAEPLLSAGAHLFNL